MEFSNINLLKPAGDQGQATEKLVAGIRAKKRFQTLLGVTDSYIEKDAKINEFIDRLRHSATQSALTRRDFIIVASVSCIYGIGDPEEYAKMSLDLKTRTN